VTRTKEEEEKYWLKDSPRQKEHVTLYLPADEFSYETLKSHLFRFVTWVLNDPISLEPEKPKWP
jgi:hypothetical protein